MVQNRFVLAVVAAVFAASWLGPVPARAQMFTAQTDPRPILGNLIAAFQNCGPPQAYQMLGLPLFQTISMQTNNMGCYQQIQAAGPITSMNVTGVQVLPAGPVFSVRVTHQNATPVDWFIGLSNLTGRVEYLNYLTVPTGAAPLTPQSVSAQQTSSGQITNPAPISTPNPPPAQSSPSVEEACRKFPVFCQ